VNLEAPDGALPCRRAIGVHDSINVCEPGAPSVDDATKGIEVSEAQAKLIARDAYVHAYPLVLQARYPYPYVKLRGHYAIPRRTAQPVRACTRFPSG
jgi:hypothetical protein